LTSCEPLTKKAGSGFLSQWWIRIRIKMSRIHNTDVNCSSFVVCGMYRTVLTFLQPPLISLCVTSNMPPIYWISMGLDWNLEHCRDNWALRLISCLLKPPYLSSSHHHFTSAISISAAYISTVSFLWIKDRCFACFPPSNLSQLNIIISPLVRTVGNYFSDSLNLNLKSFYQLQAEPDNATIARRLAECCQVGHPININSPFWWMTQMF